MARKPDIFSKIPAHHDSDSDTPEKCRKRRRRRIEMRRMRLASARLFSSQFQPPIIPPETRPQIPNFVPSRKHYLVEQETLPKLLQSPPSAKVGMVTLTPSAVENPMPSFGCISIQGLRESMNDAWFVKENFCPPDVIGGRSLHFFAVYDGHGSSHVPRVWRRMMHRVLVEELTARVPTSKANSTDDNNSAQPQQQQKEQNDQELDEQVEWENLTRVGLERSFQRMDELAVSTCFYGYHCQVLQQQMDMAFAGSTAVVALLTSDRVVVANCGDSRAVLCRDGKPISLSSLYHKAEKADELQKIRAASGKIVYKNGVRVYGILNMSRSPGGDNVFKRVETARPEISITEREAEDECLILGSNGIWDVMSDELACKVASACLNHGGAGPRSRHYNSVRDDGRGLVLFPSKTKFAAAILCRLALGRGSQDNISVIVVDLK